MIGGPVCAWNWRATAAISAMLAVGAAPAARRVLARQPWPGALARSRDSVATALLHAADLTLLATGVLMLVDFLGNAVLVVSYGPGHHCVLPARQARLPGRVDSEGRPEVKTVSGIQVGIGTMF